MKTFSRFGIAVWVFGWAVALAQSTSAAELAVGRSAGPRLIPAHGHFVHGHGPVVVVGGGFWWGWPYGYYSYPGYYYYPTPYGYYTPYGPSYEKVGKQWGKDLKHGKVTMEQFSAFMRMDIVRASDRARSNFEAGFLKGYGKNGLSVFTQALNRANAQDGAKPAQPPQAPEQAPSKNEAPLR